MSQPSNLYAEKIFSEHPSALWAFEEPIDYLSLVTETQRSYDTWQTTNSSVSLSSSDTAPFQNSHIGLVESVTTVPGYSSFGISGALGAPILTASFSDLKDTFCIGAHLLPSEGNILSIAIGYVFIDPETSQPVSRSVSYPVSSNTDWSFISETFAVSEISAESFYPLISAVVAHPVIETDPITHKLYVNGLTVGQDSEEFNYSSLGIAERPSTPGIFGVSETDYLLPSPQYGISGKDAFYVIKDKTLLAKNSGMPLVYGAQNATVMQNSGGSPNVIIPGYGFMNDSGRHKEYTVEMWVRPNSFATDSTRMFGPVASDDGLYIDGAFLRLKFGTEVTSHYVGDSFRPLLIHIKLLKDIAILMVNGEQVGSLNFSSDTVALPSKTSSLGLDQDYLGFYTSADIPQIDMDCFAIYTYAVPQLVAKRRFAYGQAVEFPENVNTAYSGTTAYFDYNFADYTNNYAYPKTGRWYQGISDNLEFDNEILSTPDYALPQLVMQDESDYESWLLSNSGQQTTEEDLFFRFDSPGYLYFEKLRMLTQDTRAIYMVFETSGYSESKQVLMRVDDNLTDNNFEVAITGDEISYTLNYGGTETSLYVESGLIANTKAFAGIDIDGLARYFGRTFTAFFGNKSRLSLYVGSDKDFSSPFNGKIFSFNLCTNRNFQKVSGFFQDPEIISTEFVADAGDAYFGTDSSVWYRTFDGGFVDSFSLDAASTHIASYTLRPKEIFGTYKLDILADSYWEDYLPLKYFAQYVTNSTSGPYYDLDFLQFNISYPAIRKFINGGFDTSGNSVKTYVTFQYLATGATSTREYFTNTEPAPQNGIVEPGDNWMTTKYEVVNGSIIYLPKSINFSDIAIVTSIEIISQGISLDKIKIKSLEYASQAFNGDTSNPVGTRFGIPVFPYRRYNAYYDYKTRNPYKIYKRSSPYLYLTSDSGIKKVGDQTRIIDRGISIPVNLNLSENYRVVSMQLAMRYDEESFPEGKVKVFEIESKNAYIRFYLERSGNSGKRARLYSVNAVTGAVNDGIAFYLNGKLVREPFIDLDQWNMLGVTFFTVLDFDSYSGAIRITGPMLVNNISQYQSTNLQEIQEQDFRKWLELASNPADLSNLGWRFWSNTYIWNGVLVKSSTSTYGITPDDIYKTYIGTNKIIVDDSQSILIGDYEYSTYSDVSWTTSITTPV